MIDNLQEMENSVLKMLLRPDDAVLLELQTQLAYPHSRTRELTGAGFFTYFTWSSNVPPLLGSPCFEFGDVLAEVPGLEYGITFIIFVRDGFISILEGVTFDLEAWPAIIRDFKLSYNGKNVRNIDEMKKTTKWPSL